MSNIRVNQINDTSGGNAAVLNGVVNAPQSMGFRNRIINGDMRIDQRNNGAAATGNDGVFGVDRWVSIATQTSRFTVQQNAGSVVPPAGFSNYLGVVSSSAFSVGATDFFQVRQRIEGFNTSDLAWGTTSAQAVTLSFWVRSSLTGTFGGSVNNSAFSRSYPFSYTISAANTWEYKTVTIAGDTSGTWLGGNNTGIQVSFNLGSGTSMSGTAGSWSGAALSAPTGATSVVGTSGATFYITGVQLEAGTVATPFERRAYGQELALCQRYFQKSYNLDALGGTNTFTGASFVGAGVQNAGLTTGYLEGREPFPVRMRAAPTVTGWDIVGNLGRCTRYNPNIANNHNETASFGATERYVICFSFSGANANTLGFHWYASAEL